jgi:hypothetical protein
MISSVSNLAFGDELKNPSPAARTAASLARVLLDLGAHDRVQVVCRERLAASTGRLDERGTLHLLEALAASASAQGQSVRAARLFGGFDDHRPVSVSMACVDGGVVGVYAVATLPEARGRG